MGRRRMKRAVLCGAISVVGCADSNLTDGGTDVSPDRVNIGALTFDYVVNALTIDDTDGVDVAHTGFNVDGLFSGPTDADGCNHADFFSLHDRDQHRPSGCAMGSAGCAGGVDNQLPTIINSVQAAAMGMDLRLMLAEQVRTGSITLLIRVSGVDDIANDPAVSVRIWEGYAEFTDCGAAFSGNAEYSVSIASLRTGGTNIDTDASFNFPGSIVDGRLVVSTATGMLRVPLPEITGTRVNLDLNQVQVRLSLAPDGTHGTNGDIGGFVLGNTLVATRATGLPPEFLDAAYRVIAAVVDVRLRGTTVCTDLSNLDMPQLGGISMGFGFSTVRARIRPTAVQARTPGTCGTQSMDGGRG